MQTGLELNNHSPYISFFYNYSEYVVGLAYAE